MHSPFVIVLASALENDVPWSERFHHDYYGDFPPIPQLSLYLTRPLTYISQQWVPCILYVGYHNWWGSCEMMRTIIKTRRVETGLFFSSVANFDWLIFHEMRLEHFYKSIVENLFFKIPIHLKRPTYYWSECCKNFTEPVCLDSRQIRWKAILYWLIRKPEMLHSN